MLFFYYSILLYSYDAPPPPERTAITYYMFNINNIITYLFIIHWVLLSILHSTVKIFFLTFLSFSNMLFTIRVFSMLCYVFKKYSYTVQYNHFFFAHHREVDQVVA